jgi:predicted GNAT superfamily acetyltransferase
MSNLDIRPLRLPSELEIVVRLQEQTPGQAASVISRPMLISFARNGGLVLGAFHQGQLVGYLISYLGLESPDANRPALANLKLVSQRMGVLPDYQNQNLGYALKVAQRQFCLTQGIRFVSWTFDPLRSRNAHLNIRKLGAICREYQRDFYDLAPDSPPTMRNTDRLLVEWWVTHHRVDKRINNRRSDLTIEQYLAGNAPIVNPSQLGQGATAGLPLPPQLVELPFQNLLLVEMPNDIDLISQQAPELAAVWRAHLRDMLEVLLSERGYAITDFLHAPYMGRQRSFYVLSLIEFNETPRFSTN